ncbi:MAG: apolipoprotein N-acyltransferase [Hyphomicrobiaceae bacterium]|nr:apolipoprotein N-acyltransferase [Hyphomicrobiaceae bacterium]
MATVRERPVLSLERLQRAAYSYRQQVMGLRGWRRTVAAIVAGALSVLAMAPFHLWPVLILTLPVLVWLLDDPPTPHVVRSAAADGWSFGFGYFLAGLFWIGEAFLVEAHIFGWLMPFAVLLMPAGLALFWAGLAAAARIWWPAGVGRLLVLAVAFGLGEYARGHLLTGFPWNTLGYALAAPGPLMQAAGVVGIYGLTLLTVSISAAPLVMLAERADWRTLGLVSVLPASLLLGYGVWVLPSGPVPSVPGVALRLVQPSIPQADKWAADKQGAIFADHLALSRQNAAGEPVGLAGVTAVIWPEAAMPFLPLATPVALEEIGKLLPTGTALLAGALRIENSQTGDVVEPSKQPKRRVYNSLLVFGVGGGLAGIYDKIHLVPFGEYLPLQSTLEAIGLEALTRLRGGFASGERPRRLLQVPGLPPVGPLICYEAIFPAAVVQGAERPGMLVNITNDGWFGETTGPYQHLHQARVRAVEEGVPVIRAANNGVSAVIDPYGRIVASLGLNLRGSLDSSLPKASPPGLYALYGDNTFLLMIMGYLCAAAALFVVDQRRA